MASPSGPACTGDSNGSTDSPASELRSASASLTPRPRPSTARASAPSAQTRSLPPQRTTKVTFYRHFPTKDDLVAAYLDRQSAQIRDSSRDSAGGSLRGTQGPGRRPWAPKRAGPDSAAARSSTPPPNTPPPTTRSGPPSGATGTGSAAWWPSWQAGSGPQHPELAADQLIMLRDGAMVHGYVDDPRLWRGLTASGRTRRP